MARIPLPPMPDEEVCPTCKRPRFYAVFGSCMGEAWHHIGYTHPGLIGNAVDPLEIKGPRIGTDEDAD